VETDTTPAPTPKAVVRRPRIAVEQLLDAATAVFAEEGFERAKMDAIATRAGTTKPTLYARFGSKEELFAAAVEREYGLRQSRLFEAYETEEDRPFRDRLHTWVTAYFDLAAERPHGFALVSEGERHPASARAIERGASAIVERIAVLVIQTSGRGSQRGARLVAATISGMLRSCAAQALRDEGVELADAALLCESLLYSALRGVDADLIDAVG
jgi:AcrR family transcriptional regulator